MVSICELWINVVIDNKLKVLNKLEPKGNVAGTGSE